MRQSRPILFACAAVLAFTSAAPSVLAQPASIERQPLDTVLKAFARETGLQLIYVSDVTRGLDSAGSAEGADAQHALTQILAGTGLTFEFLNERTVEIRASASASPQRIALTMSEPAAQADDANELSGAADSSPLEEIIVTARKRKERLLDVPMAVSAFGGEALEQRGAANLADFLQEAPGVNIFNYGDGRMKISIRGISTSLGANENGFYLDELPFTGVSVPINADVRSWDLERVEVLRGPQGTLFGEGSMGGTIRILTRDAQLNSWQMRGLVTGSDTSGGGTNSGAKAAINIPIVEDMLALRLAGTKEKYDGWIDDPASGRENINDQDIVTYRAKLRFEPTDQLAINASYWGYDAKYPRDALASNEGAASVGQVMSNDIKYELFGVTGNYDLGAAALFYSYARNDFANPVRYELPFGTIVGDIDILVESHELRAASDGEGALQWTVGLYQRDADRRDEVDGAALGILNLTDFDARSQAIFGEATYTLPNVPVDLTAGLRYVREELGVREVNSGVITPENGGVYKSTNPRAIVAWRPTDHWRLYASAAKGYRAGLPQPGVSRLIAEQIGMELAAMLPDDSIWSYEIGSKASLLAGRLVLEAAVYHSDWKDVAVRIPIALTTFNGLASSDGTETNGIEASAVVALPSGWGFSLAGSYSDAKYAGDVPGTGIRKGKPVDDHAKVTASASVDYSTTVFGGLQGSGRVGVQYNSRRDLPSFGPPQNFPGDAITTVTARIGIEGKNWGAFLFGDNLTNEDGAISPRTVNFLLSGATETVATRLRPRTVGVEFRFDFGGL